MWFYHFSLPSTQFFSFEAGKKCEKWMNKWGVEALCDVSKREASEKEKQKKHKLTCKQAKHNLIFIQRVVCIAIKTEVILEVHFPFLENKKREREEQQPRSEQEIFLTGWLRRSFSVLLLCAACESKEEEKNENSKWLLWVPPEPKHNFLQLRGRKGKTFFVRRVSGCSAHESVEHKRFTEEIILKWNSAIKIRAKSSRHSAHFASLRFAKTILARGSRRGESFGADAESCWSSASFGSGLMCVKCMVW